MTNLTSDTHIKVMEESEFEMLINRIRSNPGTIDQLHSLLQEQSSCYTGHSANAVIRMRGYLLYSFYLTTLPGWALPYIFEELESSREPYTVAAAALALQRSAIKQTGMANVLLTAFRNIKFFDGYISFSGYYQDWPLKKPTTAIRSILQTLSWLGSYAQNTIPTLKLWAENKDRKLSLEHVNCINETISIITSDDTPITDCCSGFTYGKQIPTANFLKKLKQKKEIKQFVLEDHDGNKILYEDFFKGRHTLAAFFYTRCDNPLKCSLTITNLADIQQKIIADGLATEVKLAAISYDAFYDGPEKLKTYGEARGLKLGADVRLFRSITDFTKVKEYFELGVNYTGQVVNRHIIELYLINENGEPVMTFQREQMKNDEIIAQLKLKIAQTNTPSAVIYRRIKNTINNLNSVIIPIFVLFIPKCPLCFAAYMSMLGIAGIQVGPYLKFVFPVLAILMVINFYFLYIMGKKRNNFLPMYLSIAGSAIVIAFGYYVHFKPGLVLGLIIIFIAALLNSLPNHILLKIYRYRT